MTGGTTGERLSAVDASNLILDRRNQSNVMVLAGVLAPGGFVAADGTPDVDRLRAALAPRVADVARLHQRVVEEAGGPYWVDCAVDLSRHVRVLGPVDGEAGFTRLCGELMTVSLPRDRPLWELLLVPGAEPGRPGLVLRLHHAAADGLAAVRIVRALCDPGAAVPGARPAPAAPGGSRDVVPGWRGRVRRLLVGVVRVTSLVRRAVPRTALLGPLGRRRGVAFVDVDLAGLRAGARAAGGTVNDALLAAVAAGLGDLLRELGERVPDVLRASEPVALRRGPGAGAALSGNRTGVMLVPLPLAEPDPGRRLRRIAAVTRDEKWRARAQGSFELTRSRWGTRLFDAASRHQRLAALFVTNLPGPRGRLSLAGAPLVSARPVSILAGNVRLAVAAISYAGRLCCGVHYDADALPQAPVFVRAVGRELGRLAAGG